MLSRTEALSALERRDGRLRGALQQLVYGDDAAHVFDLGSRDASGDPLVRRWCGQGMDLVDERATFRQWLEERIPRSFLKLEPEPNE